MFINLTTHPLTAELQQHDVINLPQHDYAKHIRTLYESHPDKGRLEARAIKVASIADYHNATKALVDSREVVFDYLKDYLKMYDINWVCITTLIDCKANLEKVA